MQQVGDDVVVLSAPGGTIVLPEGAAASLVASLRRALFGSHPVGAVVDTLAASGVSGLPSFCAVFPNGDRSRVLVRGDGVASVTSTDGTVTNVVARVGMTAWREEQFEGVIAVALQSNTSTAPVIEVLLAAPMEDQGDEIRLPESLTPAAPAPPAAPTPPVEIEPVVEEQRSPAEHTLAVPHEPTVDIELELGEEQAPAGPSPRPGADEPDFDFSHLLEHTHFRGAEAAAVRPPEEPVAAAPPPGATPVTPPPSPASPPPSAPGGLIDGIPGAPAGAAAPTGTPAPPPADGDHDGHTIAASALRAALGAQPPPAAPSSVGVGVQAVFCVSGHPNPPHAGQCRSCAGAIDDRTVRGIARPALGRLRFSSGAVVELDRPQLVGRRPTVDPAQPVSELPGLITIPDPDQALSRVHAEVRLEGWDVFIVDRGSKNGTFVEIPGHAPTKLRAGEPCLIVAGTRVTLADISTFEFDVGGP